MTKGDICLVDELQLLTSGDLQLVETMASHLVVYDVLVGFELTLIDDQVCDTIIPCGSDPIILFHHDGGVSKGEAERYSKWVLKNVQKISKFLEVSSKDFEDQVMGLFTEIEQTMRKKKREEELVGKSKKKQGGGGIEKTQKIPVIY